MQWADHEHWRDLPAHPGHQLVADSLSLPRRRGRDIAHRRAGTGLLLNKEDAWNCPSCAAGTSTGTAPDVRATCYPVAGCGSWTPPEAFVATYPSARWTILTAAVIELMISRSTND